MAQQGSLLSGADEALITRHALKGTRLRVLLVALEKEPQLWIVFDDEIKGANWGDYISQPRYKAYALIIEATEPQTNVWKLFLQTLARFPR
jgi:hypothetical protein